MAVTVRTYHMCPVRSSRKHANRPKTYCAHSTVPAQTRNNHTQSVPAAAAAAAAAVSHSVSILDHGGEQRCRPRVGAARHALMGMVQVSQPCAQTDRPQRQRLPAYRPRHLWVGEPAQDDLEWTVAAPNTSGHSKQARSGLWPATTSSGSMHPRNTTSSHSGPTTRVRSCSSVETPTRALSSARRALVQPTGVARSVHRQGPTAREGISPCQRRR